MKQTLLAICFAFITAIANAQAPQAIPYQAVARDNSGNVVANQNISLRFSIHDANAGGTVVYRETQSATTNSLGLFNINIGQGTAVTGTFASINWATNAKFMQVEMDPTGGITYVDMGTQQMMSVPYALYSSYSASDDYNATIGNIDGTRKWVMPGWNVTSITNTASLIQSDRIVFTPIFVSTTTTYDQIGVQATGVSGTGSLRLGIYSWGSNNLPENLIQDFGTVSLASGGSKTINIALTLNRGYYYLAWITDVNSSSLHFQVPNSAKPPVSSRGSSPGSVVGTCINSDFSTYSNNLSSGFSSSITAGSLTSYDVHTNAAIVFLHEQ